MEGVEEPEEEQLPDHASWTTMEQQSIAAFQHSLLLKEEEEWESIDKPRRTMDETRDVPEVSHHQTSRTGTGADKDQEVIRSRPTPTSSGEVVIGNVTVAWRAWPRLYV